MDEQACVQVWMPKELMHPFMEFVLRDSDGLPEDHPFKGQWRNGERYFTAHHHELSPEEALILFYLP